MTCEVIVVPPRGMASLERPTMLGAVIVMLLPWGDGGALGDDEATDGASNHGVWSRAAYGDDSAFDETIQADNFSDCTAFVNVAGGTPAGSMKMSDFSACSAHFSSRFTCSGIRKMSLRAGMVPLYFSRGRQRLTSPWARWLVSGPRRLTVPLSHRRSRYEFLRVAYRSLDQTADGQCTVGPRPSGSSRSRSF